MSLLTQNINPTPLCELITTLLKLLIRYLEPTILMRLVQGYLLDDCDNVIQLH